MKPVFRSLLARALGALCLASLALVARAQSPLPTEDTLAVGGLPAVNGGQSWGYVFWQTNSLDLLNARMYSVWSKPGTPTSAAPYERISIVGLQTDPHLIAALVDRAVLGLGEDKLKLEETVNGLFANLIPSGALKLENKISAIVRGVIADPHQLQRLLLGAKIHPALNLVLGQACSLPIPAAGPTTVEVRGWDPIAKRDTEVLGRVTIDAAVPTILPAVTVVKQAPANPRPGYDNLNIKLLWDMPSPLRRVQLLMQGFNLYRVNRAFAESAGWNTTPPTAAVLHAQLGLFPDKIARANGAPAQAQKVLTAAEVNAAAYDVSFFTDDEVRMPGYPGSYVKPKNGDQYYYFVLARNALGTDKQSLVSPGVLATFCERMPPDIPVGLKVTNQYSYNNGSPKQVLKLTWKANDNSGPKKTTAYLVYRWTRNDGPMISNGDPVNPMPQGYDPLVQLIAGPIAHVNGQATFSYVDDQNHPTWGPPPTAPADYHKTFWYTVRAVDNGSFDAPPGGPYCNVPPFGGNLSGHSPPAYGTLRDREGPAKPDGVVRTLCARPGIKANKVVPTSDPSAEPGYAHIDFFAEKLWGDPHIQGVEYQINPGTGYVPVAQVVFPDNELTVTYRLSLPITPDTPSAYQVRARTISSDGLRSAWAEQTLGRPNGTTVARAQWIASMDYTRVVYDGRTCTTHYTPQPGVPTPDGPGIWVDFFPPVGTKQYKLYYRTDDGPLTLAKEASKNFDPAVLISVLFDALPAANSRLCLFLQVFDVDGNPSPMATLCCIDLPGTQKLPKPMLTPISSVGTDGNETAVVKWFCPPVGVDRFQLWISSGPQESADNLSALLTLNPGLTPATSLEKNGPLWKSYQYKVYNTEFVGPLFGDGSVFTLNLPATPGQHWRVKVRAMTDDGEVGPFSNIEKYTWVLPPPAVGPDVPWPARPLPGTGAASEFGPDLQAGYFPVEGFVGVRIGAYNGRVRTVTTGGVTGKQLETTDTPNVFLYEAQFQNPDTKRTIFPCVLYRTQVVDPAAPPTKPLPNYPTVPGDIVQVSPLMESMAYRLEAATWGGNAPVVYDPFIHIVSVNLGSTTLNQIFLKDTNPVISGARYQYFLVLFDPVTKEQFKVIATNTVDIP